MAPFAFFSFLDRFFLVCALFGGIVFIVRNILYFTGMAGDSGGDGSLEAFNVLSLQSISAFLCISGLTGLGLSRAAFSPWIAVAGATAAGALTVWLLKFIFKKAAKLQSDGSLDLHNAIGKTATVYLSIKPKTGGQVQAVVQGRLLTQDAFCKLDKTIPTGQRVIIVGIENNAFLVEPEAR